MRKLCVVLWMIVTSVAAGAQVPDMPIGSRLVNLPTYRSPGASTLELIFTHRFSQTASDAGGYDWLGLDSAADVGIGLTLGLTRRLAVEVYRTSFFKQVEGAVRWDATRQGDSFPFSVALRGGVDYRGARGVEDRWSGIVQVIVARRLGHSLELLAVPTFASDTPTVRNAFNLGIGVAYHLPRGWLLAGEVVPKNRDARIGTTGWSVGVAKRVPGHEFMLWLGNSRATTQDLMAGSDYPGGFEAGDVRVGFNLVRRFPE